MATSRARTRILFVIATLDPAGAERQLVSLCVGLSRFGFEPGVCCLTRGGPLSKELADAGIPVWVLGKRSRWDLSVLPSLIRRIRRFHPQVVHTWLFTCNALGRAAAIIGRAPVIVASERAVDIWKTPMHRAIDRFLGRFTARVIVNAEAVRRFCIERIGLPPRKVVLIRNGIDLAAFDQAASRAPMSPLPMATRGALIGTVARLSRQKGISYLLEAFGLVLQEAPETALWIVGDGEDRAELEDLAARLGVAERVAFLGHREDVPAILRRLNVFALPSLWEGLPNAIIEAMAAARPVVATAVDGSAELVEDGVTGWLVPPKSPQALAEKLLLVLPDRVMQKRMGQAGRQRVEREFGQERMIAETAAIYRQLVGEQTALDSNGRGR